MIRVVFTAEADADLAAIADYIAAESSRSAVRFVLDIQAACDAIGVMPLASPLAEELQGQGVRRKVYRRYLIFYRIAPEAVEILHIIHGARDLAAVLNSDP